MATQKDVLERLGTREELVYWSEKNNISIEEIDSGYFVEEWKVTLEEDRITSVERRLDEPQSL
jgi:hypothetical protein